MPDGYDTDVAKGGGRLSAGQRQLVAFARAFLADPAVLVLDEATSSLDVPSERLVQRALQTVLADRTAVIIAHRLSTVEIADRVLVVERGEIVEQGTPAGLLLEADGRYAALHSGLGGLARLSEPSQLATESRGGRRRNIQERAKVRDEQHTDTSRDRRCVRSGSRP